jgi:hypothetical protein
MDIKFSKTLATLYDFLFRFLSCHSSLRIKIRNILWTALNAAIFMK